MAMFARRTYYEILGVRRNSNSHEIKNAFRKLALIYHPDVSECTVESDAIFKIINNAYSILSDGRKRIKYNEYLDTNAIFNGSSYRPPGKKSPSGHRPYFSDEECEFIRSLRELAGFRD